MRAFLFPALLIASLALACSGETRPNGIDLGANGDPLEPSWGGGTQARYPQGPYGYDNPAIGEVVPNIQLMGYQNPTGIGVASEQTYGAFSLSDLRGKEARYLLIHPVAMWCGSCYVEAAQLNRYLESIVGAEGAVLQLVIDGSAPSADPTKSELDSWIAFNDLKMTTAIAGDDHLRDVFSDRGYVFIVDLDTMKVVYQLQGVQLDPTIVQIAVPEMMSQWLGQPN